MRAATILEDQVELPILWMAKKKKALELREFHADVLRLLQYWATDDGVNDLVARTGELVKQAYPNDKASWAMEAIVAPLSVGRWGGPARDLLPNTSVPYS